MMLSTFHNITTNHEQRLLGKSRETFTIHPISKGPKTSVYIERHQLQDK